MLDCQLLSIILQIWYHGSKKRGKKSPLDGGRHIVQKHGEHATDVVFREKYEQLKSRNTEQEQANALAEALRLTQHQRLGTPSYKSMDDGSHQLSFLFKEGEFIADHEVEQDKPEAMLAAHKRHKKNEYPQGQLTIRRNNGCC